MKHYQYIGNDPLLLGTMALGRFIEGRFQVQVDNFEHAWANGWHTTSLEDWLET